MSHLNWHGHQEILNLTCKFLTGSELICQQGNQSRDDSIIGSTFLKRSHPCVEKHKEELINVFKMDYKKTASYKQMLRGKDLVWDWYLGGLKKNFHAIPSLLARIEEVDNGAIVDWSSQVQSNTFM